MMLSADYKDYKFLRLLKAKLIHNRQEFLTIVRDSTIFIVNINSLKINILKN